MFNLQIVAISVGVVSVAVGIGIPIFYEIQFDNAVSCFADFSCSFNNNSKKKKNWVLLKIEICVVVGKEREHPGLFSL